jgi:hypothetical protein
LGLLNIVVLATAKLEQAGLLKTMSNTDHQI